MQSVTKNLIDDCKGDAYFFLQVQCTIPEEKIHSRKLIELLLSSIGIFIYLFVLIFVDYIKAVEINRYVDFDVQTITASDYTVEF